MNIDLIIEALSKKCENCHMIESHCMEKCNGKALAEARKMKEPCVWKRIDGWATFNTGCGVYSNLSATDYCPGCGRKVKYED